MAQPGSNYFIDRGMRGFTPAVTNRSDEAFLDYVSTARNILMYSQQPLANKSATDELNARGATIDYTPEAVAGIREVVKDVPVAATWLRIKRTAQEAFWQRVVDTFKGQEDVWLARLDESDNIGPGTVKWDPDFDMPEYAKSEVHLQHGGYVANPLAGLHYDAGTRVFWGGDDDGDKFHTHLAKKTAMPLDGKAERILDIGTSIGQQVTEFKKLYPEKEIWGIDISAPLIRFAHYRAVQQGLDVNFAQMASERLDFEDGYFDVVSAHILFHEIPTEVIERTLREVKRVLRPGGTFVIWDLPTGQNDGLEYTGFFGIMDATDNCEPYAPCLAKCNLEDMIREAGYNLRYEDPEEMARHGRVCDKPE